MDNSRLSALGSRLSALGLALCYLRPVAAAAQATEPGAWVPAGGGPMPHYFSGTNAYASGNAYSVGGTIMVEAWLKLDGVVVKHWVKPPGEPGSQSVGLETWFDSTHAGPTATIDVEFDAVDNEQNWYSAHGWAPARNRCVAFQRPEFAYYGANGVWELSQHVGPFIGWEWIDVQHDGWDSTDIASALYDAAIYYVSSHGHAGSYHETDLNLGAGAMESVYSDTVVPNYLVMRMFANGSGLPPYNDTYSPPVSFSMLDFCTSGFSNAFSTLLFPYENHYGGWTVDQAVWTWNGYTRLVMTQNDVWHVFSRMKNGKTAWKARYEFLLQMNSPSATVNRPVDIIPWDDPGGESGTYRRVLYENDCPIWGDWHTKIKNVYTGHSGPVLPPGWYR